MHPGFSRYYCGDRIPQTTVATIHPSTPSPFSNIVPHLPHEYVQVIQSLIGFHALYIFPGVLLAKLI